MVVTAVMFYMKHSIRLSSPMNAQLGRVKITAGQSMILPHRILVHGELEIRYFNYASRDQTDSTISIRIAVTMNTRNVI